jgi:hypothetical protein
MVKKKIVKPIKEKVKRTYKQIANQNRCWICEEKLVFFLDSNIQNTYRCPKCSTIHGDRIYYSCPLCEKKNHGRPCSSEAADNPKGMTCERCTYNFCLFHLGECHYASETEDSDLEEYDTFICDKCYEEIKKEKNK